MTALQVICALLDVTSDAATIFGTGTVTTALTGADQGPASDPTRARTRKVTDVPGWAFTFKRGVPTVVLAGFTPVMSNSHLTDALAFVPRVHVNRTDVVFAAADTVGAEILARNVPCGATADADEPIISVAERPITIPMEANFPTRLMSTCVAPLA